MERSDGVLGFSKTKFYFEQKKIDKKLANWHAEQILEKVTHNSEITYPGDGPSPKKERDGNGYN